MSGAVLTLLEWDSELFGFPVARLNVPGGDMEAAAGALARARQEGVALVYWQVDPGVTAPPALLAEFGGGLTDRRGTFVADLAKVGLGEPCESVAGVSVREYPPGPASEALTALAVSAGAFSRFFVDPRFPRDRFVALYAAWVDRSARREIADVVFEAAAPSAGPLGLVTVSEAGGNASIGLMAVGADVQGRGIGRQLIRAAHRWMAGRGVGRAGVVTQMANVAACRLYEGCGYRLAEVTHYYHFWPQGGSATRC
jgi:dTDP-4-amino-4,6-dideoxy-D-galactose acyltransferase